MVTYAVFSLPVGSHSLFLLLFFGPYLRFCLYICGAISDQLIVTKMLCEHTKGHTVFSDVLKSVL